MSSINFANLRKQNPSLKTVFSAIEHWFATHSNQLVVDPRRIRRSIADASPEDVGKALSLLVDRGYFDQLYAIELPNGSLLSEPLRQSPYEFPESVSDRYDNQIATKDARIVPVLRKAR